VHELDPILAGMRLPGAGVDDLVAAEPLERRFGRLAQYADPDADERAARRRLGVAERGLAGQELLDRAGDRVVQRRIVLLEPLPEVLVAAPRQARGPRPRAA